MEQLEERALTGLDLVVDSLDRTIEAVQHRDIELAELVIAGDDVIDGRYLEIHQSILTLLATQAIEHLMNELKSEYTFVIVTHNMQQAARVADMTAFFSISRGDEGQRWGELIEYDATQKIFTAPSDNRTEDYVTGRFG